ncbi:MAG: Polysaccharide biosynthesis protein [archaeon ADurb.Bin336]|nr:MAG: Polysaccharide biosynthesis protein [archaeon ADurb.Bin336]
MLSKINSLIKDRPILEKILKNISWLTLERGFQLFLSVFVGIWVVRYLGPSDFGLMNFAMAFGSIFSPFIGLGVSSILLREFIKHPENKNVLSGTAFWITFVTGVIITISMNIVILFVRPNDFEAFLVVFVLSLGNVLLAFDVISIWFDSKTESNKTVLARNLGLIFSYMLRIYFILAGFPLIFFMIAALFDSVIRVILFLFFYYKDKQNIFLWRFDFQVAKKLLSVSWPLIFSGVMIVIYMKIDQVMIGLMLSDYEVGLYSVAVKLSEVVYFLPGVIMVSLLPSLIKSKLVSKKFYQERLQKLFDFMTWFPFILILPIFFFSSQIIVFLYGQEYIIAGQTLAISIWALFAVFIKVAVENYLLNENLTKIIFFTSFLGSISNVLLNLIFIPFWGINGAALTTVISYLIASYLGLIFFKETRPIFIMLLKSLNLVRVLNSFKQYCTSRIFK